MNKKIHFTPKLVSFAIASVLGVSSFALQAAEQETSQISIKDKDGNMEVIEVTGIRGSIIKAMDIKRSSNGVVDAISAEDIGKFPDTNLAESLQRISGVSIDRQNGEGNQVSVRGFGPSFNLVTLNGRAMPYASSPKQEGAGSQAQNRSFNFAEVSSESVSGVEIYKTGKANTTTGGIGATVNVTTAKPLQFQGFKSAFSVKGVMDNSNVVGSDITPEFSGMVSNKFFDGKFGALVSYSVAERDSRTVSATSDGWLRQGPNCEQGYTTEQCPGMGAAIDDSAINTQNNPDKHFWRSQNYNMDFSDHSRTRTNGSVVLQFQPNKDLTFTADYLMTRFEDQIERHQVAHWLGNWVGGTTDENGTVVKTVSGAGGTDFIGFYDDIETKNDSAGLNVDWQINDSLKATFDYHHSTAHSQPGGVLSDKAVLLTNADFSCNGVAACYFGGYDLDYSTGTQLPILGAPVPIVDSSGFYPGAELDQHGRSHANADPYDPDLLGGNLAIGRGNEVKNTIDQWQLDLAYYPNSNVLTSVDFGIGMQAYEVDTTWRFHNTNIAGIDLRQVDIEKIETAGLLSDFSGSETLFPYYMDFNVDELYNLASDTLGGLSFNPFTYNNIKEDIAHVYVQGTFELAVANMPLSIVAGLRYETTDVTGTTNQDTVLYLQYESITELRPAYSGENYALTQFEGDYDSLLPNIDISLEVTEDVVARLSYGKSLTRSDLVALRPASVIANSRPGGPYLAYQGNSALEPYESDNIDLSLEWYYGEGSYAAISYFTKDVDNYIVNKTIQAPYYNSEGEILTEPSLDPTNGLGGVNDCPANGGGSTDPNCRSQQAGQPDIVWQTTSPENGDSASVDGFEIAVQHLFAKSGFGLQANATFVDGDVEYDSFETAEQTALLGLSDSANFVFFYDNHGLQARIAYNWRDDFLLSMDQLRAPDEPVFTEEYGQWDANVSYDITENLTVFIEGLNIGEENIRQHGRFQNQLVSAQEYSARYNFGIRGSF
ncbi:MAG: TonB-dependent receptor [Thalassotalea sp.]